MGKPSSFSSLTLFLLLLLSAVTSAAISSELLKGFKATPDPSTNSFQSLLTDPTRNFSLAFLRVNQTQLSLAIIHLPSSEPLWVANPTRLAPWSKSTQLTFNGSLVISYSHTGVVWSTDTNGDRVTLLNSSNLQIIQSDAGTILWESFNYPDNTLVQNQNFTSAMTLISSNRLYSMRLGDNFFGLYAKFGGKSDQIYWKQRALQAKAEIVFGSGPIYARVNPDGYMGLYQTNDSIPVDVQAFNSFNRPLNRFLIIRVEPDGNLKAYYWTGSGWVLDYQLIRAECELPNPCGPYGLCKPGKGCSCLDNTTTVYVSGECSAAESGDFCGGGVADNGFEILRRDGVELPFKELMDYQTTTSLKICEGLCAKNCKCWGAVYNNASGFCYLVEYPIQTLVSVGDESKVGYFKVRKGAGVKVESGFKIGIGLVGGVLLLIVVIIGVGSYKYYWRNRHSRGNNKMYTEDDGGISPGPYKDLASASFRSIQLCSTSSR